MKKRMLTGALSIALRLSALLSFSGCVGTTAQATDLMAGDKANAVDANVDLTGDDVGAAGGFAVNLFQNSVISNENILVSLLSVLCAFSMTANGAKGETLPQMEDVFGLSVPELHAYLKYLPSGSKYKVSVADSIWFKDDESLKEKPGFLQTNADYYGATIYS